MGLTEKQAKVMSFMSWYRYKFGKWPSRRRIAMACQISSHGSVNRIIDALIERGHLTERPLAEDVGQC